MSQVRRNQSRRPGLLPVLALLVVPAAVPAQDADHLLLSEVVVRTRVIEDAPFGSPFIEVVNPTGVEADLSDVYLSTAHDTQLGQFYWNVAVGENSGGGSSGNVHCRFPAGLRLAAGDTLVIALNGTGQYEDAYGRLPDLELFEDGLAPDQVPEMVEVATGSIGAGLGSSGTNTPALSTTADSIVLYRWTGGDLVEDLDYLIYGADQRVRIDKTGVAVGESTYLPDTAVGAQVAAAGTAPTFGHALRRVNAVESGEPQSGGNGATGHDETGENLLASWDDIAAQEPATPPATWFPPAPIVLAGSVGPSYADLPTVITVTAVAYDEITGMEVRYRVDGGAWQTATGADQGGDTWSAAIPGQVTGAALEWYATVTGSGDGVAVWPAGGDRRPRTAVVADVPPPTITGVAVGAAFTGLPCVITASVEAVDPVLSGTLHYAVDGGAFTSEPMTADGLELTGEIPSQPDGAVVDWYLEVVDSEERRDVYPEGAPEVLEQIVFSGVYDGAAKLLITEVNAGANIYPFESMMQIAPEFIEIHNPNPYAVALGDYYLTDAISYVSGQQVYWAITAGDPTQQTVGGGHYNDFTARFPDGSTIGPGQTLVVSMASSGWFERQYHSLPDLEMYADSLSVADVPAMRPVFVNPPGDLPGNSIYTPDRPYGGSADELPKGIPEMEEFYGEPLILYHWRAGDPTVTDIDVFIWGDEKTGNFRYSFDKTAVPGYDPDTPVASQDWFTEVETSGSLSYTRVDAEEGTQPASGSNGVDGRDETGENWTATFSLVYSTPGLFLAGLEPAQDVSLRVPARTFLPVLGETFAIEMVSLADSETKLRILDLEGRLVISLWDSRFDGPVSGIPEFPTRVEWDGRDDTFQRVRAGMYVVHLQAVDRVTGKKTTKTAPVVVATRLN
ncbi:MAG TPA: hypothetical protein PLL30_10100 [Candidatus Krumholzibacteria bacterium]|nr:hypothetical protein [Candidatus Krumholzibacteria bacterium]HPD72112.1 hypothetical protein [Candidatus Krumholzibacteria bacterium]HRY40956.1 hypothetical protein [Candidatus Krumholzibacteria bacterium]